MAYPNSYHVTAGPRTEAKERKCVSQEDYILDLYRENRHGLTTDEVWSILLNNKNLKSILDELYKEDPIKAYARAKSVSISSRRAITNLTNKGLLIKTTQTRKGMSGDKNRVYRINEK